MALPLLNDAESAASGTTVSTANSGSPTALDAVVVGANMTATFDNAHPAHGSNAYKLALTSTATAITHLDWIAAMSSVTEFWGAVYVYCNKVPPTSSIRMVSFRNAGAQVSGIKWASGTGAIEIMDSAGTTIVGSASAGLSVNTLYRLEWHWIFNVATGETARVDIYAGDATSPTTSSVVSATNMGAACNEVWFGFTTANFSSTAADALWLDDLNVNATGFPGPGPYSAAVPSIACRTRRMPLGV